MRASNHSREDVLLVSISAGGTLSSSASFLVSAIASEVSEVNSSGITSRLSGLIFFTVSRTVALAFFGVFCLTTLRRDFFAALLDGLVSTLTFFCIFLVFSVFLADFCIGCVRFNELAFF